jgi:hypothetical protein
MPIVVERRKKTEAGKKVKGATKSKPRPRKTRPTPKKGRDAERKDMPHGLGEPEGPQAPETGGEEGSLPPYAPGTPSSVAATRSTSPTSEGLGQAPRVLRPGELYQRTGRWWWRVKLPGEDQEKARPLKPDGEEATNGDRRSAESLAFEMWEQAVAENAVRQIQRDSTDKIERLKAQFLDKVRHFTELVETANARIEAEAAARAEAEAKLAQIQAEKLVERGTVARLVTSDVGRPATPAAQPPDNPAAPSPPATGAVVAQTTAPPPLETGACDSCGATGIALTCLKRIESGQSLCPRCLAAFQADIARAAL